MNKFISTDNNKQLDALQEWFKSERGNELLSAQRRAINRLLPNLFGYFLVELAVSLDMNLSEESLVVNKIVVGPKYQLGLPSKSVLCDATELPFEENSVDVVLLHHSLDFSENPHQVLREAYRILRPGGFMIIVGFNPSSWWGIRRYSRKRNRAVWQKANFISQSRLVDWMNLLGLTPLRCLSDYYLPPFVSDKWRNFFEKLQARGRKSMPKNGAFTVNLARKDIEGIPPVKRIKHNHKFYKLPVRKPATREQTSERS